MTNFIEALSNFFVNYGFAFEILVANIMFVYTLERKKNFILRVTFSFISFLLMLFIWNFFETRYTVWDTIKYISIIFFTVIILMFCFKISFRTAIFCEISAYATQHTAYKAGEFLQSIAEIKLNLNYNTFIYLFTVLVVYILFYHLFAKNLKKYDISKFKNNQIILLTIPLTLVSIVLGQYSYRNDYSIYTMLAIYDILCCLLMLTCQYSILKSASVIEEVSVLEQMLFLQKKQMKFSKDTIDLINIKFHDLKHQLSRLKGKISVDEIKELQDIFSMYNINIKTGNEALDIILFEKALKCWKNNIKLNCIADGKSLAYVRSSDIYSLFGNAIDNAIEAVLKIDDVDKRVISINVKRKMDMIFIHLENYFEGEIEIIDGLPQTKKKNKGYHGFGMKSIKMISGKYGGYFSFKSSENIFQLNIVFPSK